MAGPPSYPANANLNGQSPRSTMLGTPRATSITDDSETDYDPTPIHSPGGPQYDDLPPSYDEAQHQAVRGVAPIDPNQIEAHRLTLNEGPNEPEVWEYRVKGEEVDPADEREEAPDYANHTNDKATSVPVQHVSTSETIPVGRVQSVPARKSLPNPNASSASVHNDAPPFEQTQTRAAEDHADPPHSIPGLSDNQWSPFGTPGNGPFGAPGNGPFGRPGQGRFGAAGEDSTGRQGRGYGRWPGSQQQQGCEWRGNEWSEVGKDLGKMGEEFGKKMGNWGIEFGKRANAWGLDVGRMSSGSGTQSRNAPGPASEQPEDDLPPSYEAPAGQETGVFRGDSKIDTKPPVSTSGPSKSKGKDVDDYDDDDSSSISSDSSDSDSDSDSDYDDYPDTEAMFSKRMRSINEQADASVEKGKKSAEEIAHERAMAIERAEKDKETMDLKIATKLSKRMARRDLKQRKRELKRQHRQRKRELRAAHTGKGKGKAKKSTEWKEAKREYKDEKKKLRKEKLAAKKQWREAQENSQREGRREEWRDSKGEC